MQSLILSPCGTSLLSNRAGEHRGLITRHSNAKTADAVPEVDRVILQRLIDSVRQTLVTANVQQVSNYSAELNALARFYQEDFSMGLQDEHYLLCTDTWLGQTTAELVRDWLLAQGIRTAHVHRQTDLRTVDVDEFQLALSDLTLWCAQTLPGYHAARYHIVFNLTGGFKSVNGFLQSLAMLYADEVIYVFETQQALLRLPRLPVQMANEVQLRDHLVALRRLSRQLPVQPERLEGIAGVFIMRMGNEVALSPWGQAVWQENARQLYGEQLWPSPSERIVYGPGLESSLAGLSPERLWQVNQRIDDLAERLETNHPRKRLDLKEIKGKAMLPCTHEMDAWADGDARRLFGHYEGPVFVIDQLGKALH